MNRSSQWFVGLAAAVVLIVGGIATAQEYPARVVRLIVAFPPGGSTDIYARVIANEMQAAWGKSVIVENRPGVGGLAGANAVAKSTDGHTFLAAPNTIAIAPHQIGRAHV